MNRAGQGKGYDMSEEAATYTTSGELDRVRREAHALRLVMDLEPDRRADACAQLAAACFPLRPWIRAVSRELSNKPGVELPALWGMLDRGAMEPDRRQLEAAGLTLDALQKLDPRHAEEAYTATIEAAKDTRTRAYIQTAIDKLTDALDAKTPDTRDKLKHDATWELHRPDAEGAVPMNEAWDEYRRARFTHEYAEPNEVIRLDGDKRGRWAKWFNAWLGPRAGLEPGRCMIIGAGPGAGKTSIAALLAVDAMAAGVPCLFWQLELSREETLEHLLTQTPGTGNWWNDYWTKRCNRPLPSGWLDKLTIPNMDGGESYHADTIREAMLAMAHRTRKQAHACRGLVIVDYAQLLTIRERNGNMPQHEIWTKAGSMLAKTAADAGLCLVLLSQLTKSSRNEMNKEGPLAEDTALSGADWGRMAHIIFSLSHAGDKSGKWKPCGASEATKTADGEARMLRVLKRRGTYKLDGKLPDPSGIVWLSNERALHNGVSVPADVIDWLPRGEE